MINQVASFYQFVRVHNVKDLQQELHLLCTKLALFGTVLVSPEGINGTLAGAPAAIADCVSALQNGTGGIPPFDRLELKFSQAGERHFDRLKIKVKREIITFGQENADPLQHAATQVAPDAWNKLLEDPDILLLDTRNAFEVGMGSFRKAVDPKLKKFSDFVIFADENLDAGKHKKIAMFCTGGIRCEKAGAYMLAAGFANVFVLQGGILKYLETVPQTESLWQGDCFVFDQRVALRHGLAIAEELEGYCP